MFSVPPASAYVAVPSASDCAAERIACKSRSAEPVDRQRRHADRQPGAQADVAREIDRVGAALDDVAEDDFVDALVRHAAALDRGFGRRNDGEIGGGEVGQRAAEVAERRAGARRG